MTVDSGMFDAPKSGFGVGAADGAAVGAADVAACAACRDSALAVAFRGDSSLTIAAGLCRLAGCPLDSSLIDFDSDADSFLTSACSSVCLSVSSCFSCSSRFRLVLFFCGPRDFGSIPSMRLRKRAYLMRAAWPLEIGLSRIGSDATLFQSILMSRN